MGHIQTLGDLIAFLWRRRKLILGAVLLCALLAALYALQRPHLYTASASIEVQGAQVSGAALSEAGPGAEALQMLQSVRHRLTTRQNLMEIAERHGLFADQPALSADRKVQILREAIGFHTIHGTGEPTYGFAVPVSAIVINVTFTDADLAARIANDLAQGVLDMSASGQIARARDNHAFYADKLAAVETEIRAQEAGIAAFRSSHADSLPPATEAIQEELVAIGNDIRALDQQLVALAEERRQLSQRENLRPTDRQRLRVLDDLAATLNLQKNAMTAQREGLQAALAGVPAVQRDLADLERSLEQMKRNFDTTNAALAEAESALRLAELQQGERFAILDRALTPEHPTGPRRRMLVLAGALAGGLFGLVLGFLLDLLRPVIRTSAQMERELGLRPIIAIPELDLREGKPRRRLAAGS